MLQHPDATLLQKFPLFFKTFYFSQRISSRPLGLRESLRLLLKVSKGLDELFVQLIFLSGHFVVIRRGEQLSLALMTSTSTLSAVGPRRRHEARKGGIETPVARKNLNSFTDNGERASLSALYVPLVKLGGCQLCYPLWRHVDEGTYKRQEEVSITAGRGATYVFSGDENPKEGKWCYDTISKPCQAYHETITANGVQDE
ncbi:hypothetical protein BDW75DRAFT_246433 [Aspergillus navahoensis]